MSNLRKPYIQPCSHRICFLSDPLFTPSRHDEVGDGKEYSRQQDWWDEDETSATSSTSNQFF